MGILKNKIPWDLRGRGQRDSQRHEKKVKEAIRKNLHKIIAEEAIIMTDGKRQTKVPVRYLDSYHFKHGSMKDNVAHGPGEKGDIIRPGRARRAEEEAAGKKPGEKVGNDIYEAAISVDELVQMMLEDLDLPFLEEKNRKEVIETHIEYTDIRKRGQMSNWAKRQTIMENIKRNAQEGREAEFGNLEIDDMRFRSWNERIERHSNAVVYLMMDRSGSMDDHKRYLVKATFWWICRFLEKFYDNVEIVFIAHDYEAKVVPEKDFFTLSNDGGTKCSSAYDLAWKDIQESRPSNAWNVYCFHFSDGDNGTADNEVCQKLVKEMLTRVNMFAYGEVAYKNDQWHERSGLITVLREIDHDRLMTAVLRDKTDVHKALKKFLGKEMQVDKEDSAES